MIDPKFWSGRKVFVTGNTGFKGSWLGLWLQMLGAEVHGFALDPPTVPSHFRLLGPEPDLVWTKGDIRDEARLARALGDFRPEIVIHMAAQPLVLESYRDPIGTYATNVMGTVNLLNAVRRVESVRVVVNVTTDKCYENREWVWGYRENEPMGGFDPYSSSKGCAELVTSAFRQSFFSTENYGKTHQVAIASARAGNVIGGGDFAENRLIPDIIRAVEAGKEVEIRSPNAIRPWQHVLEPLSGYLVLAQRLHSGGTSYAEAWNFGPRDEDAKSVEWIVKSLCSKVPGSRGYRVEKSDKPHEANFLKLDISKATSRLGWSPRWNLDRTLSSIVEWNDQVRSGRKVREVTVGQIESYANG